jgi:hypothetical protein
LVQPADARSATAERVCPAITPDIDGTCIVTVKFPAQSLTVEYWRPSGAPTQNQLADTVREAKREIARHPGSGRAELLDLNGVPARFLSGVYTSGPEGSGSIDFLVGDTRVTVHGDQDEAALQDAAQSILDRMPAARQVALADASQVLGAPVVLPETDLVQPSDAASTASTACSVSADSATPCQVTIEFPALTKYYVPLTIRYLRPASTDPTASYEDVVKQVSGAKIVSLGGVPALYVPGPALTYPNSIEFVGSGIDTTVQGIYDESALQDMAQSVLDRSHS